MTRSGGGGGVRAVRGAATRAVPSPAKGDASLVAVAERGAGVVRFDVRVQPRASRTAVGGAHGGALRVRLAAPPVDGAANEALVDALAASLDVPRRAVRIVSGATSRGKVVEVEAGKDDVARVVARVRALAAAAAAGETR